MSFSYRKFLASWGAMSLFVLLWGSAAIFTRWALDHGSPSAVLLARYGIACLALLAALPWRRGPWLPQPGTRGTVALAGLLMVACYSVCYFQAMAHGITPGLIATLLGVQPILTLLLVERRFGAARLGGLLLALAGLGLVVRQSLLATGFDVTGLAFALGALACMTAGAIVQKRVRQAPLQVLPLQYAVTLAVCLAFAQVQPLRWDGSLGFWLPVLFLGLVISVVAQWLLYRLIQGGSLVNVTSLFYLVPAVTALLDYAVLGNALGLLAVLGMVCILAGVVLVHRQPAGAG